MRAFRATSVMAILTILAFAGFKTSASLRQQYGVNAGAGLCSSPPPALPANGWLHTGDRPLTWQDLRGKVVVLAFATTDG